MPEAPPTDTGSARVATNTIARAAGEAVAKVASVVFYVVLARRLGSTDFGVFVFALALTGALLIGAGFGTDELIARQVARRPTDAGRYLSNAVALKAVSAAVLLAVAMTVVLVGGYTSQARLTTLLVGLGVAVEVMAKSWHAVFQARQRLGIVSACLIVQRTMTAAVGIAVLLAGGGLGAAAAGYFGGSPIRPAAAEVGWRRLAPGPGPRPRPGRGEAVRLLRAGIPIGVAGLLWVALVKVDVLMLSALAGSAEVGLYAAAYRLVEGTQFLAWSFDAAMLPWLARSPGPMLTRGYMLGLKLVAALLTPLALLVVCFARQLVAVLYGAEFAGAVTPLRLLAPTIALFGVQTLSATLLIARDAPGRVSRVAAVVAIQNVVCNAVAIPLWGADGA